jgi:2-isopropylmalate synthase
LLVDAETPVVTIVGKTSLLRAGGVADDSDENLAMIGDTIAYLKRGAFRRLRRRAFVRRLQGGCQCAGDAGGRRAGRRGRGRPVRRNGGSIPGDIVEITKRVRSRIATRVGIHTHDDIGLGVANALAALEAGATHIQAPSTGSASGPATAT